jgi:hypothetical protein
MCGEKQSLKLVFFQSQIPSECRKKVQEMNLNKGLKAEEEKLNKFLQAENEENSILLNETESIENQMVTKTVIENKWEKYVEKDQDSSSDSNEDLTTYKKLFPTTKMKKATKESSRKRPLKDQNITSNIVEKRSKWDSYINYEENDEN